MNSWSWPHPKQEMWRRSQILRQQTPHIEPLLDILKIYDGNRLADQGPMHLMPEGVRAQSIEANIKVQDPYAHQLMSEAAHRESFILTSGEYNWESIWPKKDQVMVRSFSIADGESVTIKQSERGESEAWQFRVMHVRLGKGASLTWESMQELTAGHGLTYWIVEQDAESIFDWQRIHLGGAFQRDHVEVTQVGSKAHTSLSGLYIGSGKRAIESFWQINHEASDGTSSQKQRGILVDESTAVAISGVGVAKGIARIESSQKLDHILLSRQASIHTRPQLEILADDVKCDHGITVGSIDEDALFFLRSRGIPHNEARHLLLSGFLGDIWPQDLPDSLNVSLQNILDL